MKVDVISILKKTNIKNSQEEPGNKNWEAVLVPEFTKFLRSFRFRRFNKICTINQREQQDWIWFIVLRKWCRSSSTQDRKRERGKRWLKRNCKKELARVESKSPYNHGWIAEWTSWAHRERGSPEPMPVFEVRNSGMFISSIILKLGSHICAHCLPNYQWSLPRSTMCNHVALFMAKHWGYSTIEQSFLLANML